MSLENGEYKKHHRSWVQMLTSCVLMNGNKMKHVEELIYFLPNDKYWMRFLEFQILMSPLELFQ